MAQKHCSEPGCLICAVDDMERRAYESGFAAGIEAAAKECILAWPPAHTYASENADLYSAQDHVRDTIEAAIRALRPEKP